MFEKIYISQAVALNLLLDTVNGALPSENVGIEKCYGRTAASDINSQEDLPGFSRSSVDGFAVRSSDTYGAKETMPAYLTITDEVFMGQASGFEVKAGEAARIPTGGMMPEGADAVIMIEHAQVGAGSVLEALKPVASGENVIRADDDIKKGDPVIRNGWLLRPQDIGALAGIGKVSVDVVRRPVVSIICTGDEIIPHNGNIQPGQVRDINSFTLAGLISGDGAVPVKKGIFRDDYEIIRQALIFSMEESDIVLIIGGTSVGLRDMTADIIASSTGGRLLFHGVSIKPGRPLIGGIVNSKPVLGLPGHPAAVAICYEVYIRPLIFRMLGLESERIFRKTLSATMSKGVASSPGRQDHIRVRVEAGENGYIAIPVMGKSGLITTLVAADGVVIIPENRLGIDAGENVTVNLF
jgi:molybdopterin molybdotransferase